MYKDLFKTQCISLALTLHTDFVCVLALIGFWKGARNTHLT